MVRIAIIVVLLVFVAVLADRVAREENQRYAMALGMCRGATDVPDPTCLDKVQTRSAWAWQLFYGVTGPLPAVDWSHSSPP